MRLRLNLFVVIVITFIFNGCVPISSMQSAVLEYKIIAPKISIGDDKEYVLSMLIPLQASIPSQMQRKPEKFMNYGEAVDIYFLRTGINSGDLNSDDDFTPYVFKKGILSFVGWRYVSRSRYHGQALEAMSAGNSSARTNLLVDVLR